MPEFPKISPCLWFDSQAEPAAHFYTSLFPDSKITHIARYGPPGPEIPRRPPGSGIAVAFEPAGHPFPPLNGGPHFHFPEAISLQVFCEDQSENHPFRTKLSEAGDPN